MSQNLRTRIPAHKPSSSAHSLQSPNSQEMTKRRNGLVKTFLLSKHERMGNRDKSYSIVNFSHLSQRLKGEDFLLESGFPCSQMKKDEKIVPWFLCSERFHWSPHKWTGKDWAVSAFSCIWWRNKRLAFSVLVIQKNSDIIEGNYNRINNTSKTFLKSHCLCSLGTSDTG